MEFARQRISTEELHFIRAHKTSNLNFLFTLGPFTFKSKSCVAILESYLCQFQFLLAPKIRYDPVDVISKRKTRKTTEAREHEGLEGLEEISNREEPLEGQSSIGLISQIPRGIDELLPEVVQASSEATSSHKKSSSDAVTMDVDEPSSSKMTKLNKGKELDELEKVSSDDAMKIICIQEDKPTSECAGTMIDNE